MLLPLFRNINQIISLVVIIVQLTSVQNYKILYLDEGKPCKVNVDIVGICKKSTECTANSMKLMNQSYPVACALPIHDDLSELIICCPKTETEIICDEYGTAPIIPLIVKGTRGSLGEFPFMAGLAVKRNVTRFDDQPKRPRYIVMCGGSIISSRWILTAAHCVHTLNLPTHVIVGEVNLLSINEENNVFGIKQLIHHENYTHGNWYYDIGLVELNEPIEFDEVKGPICLHGIYIKKLLPEQEFTITGWGKSNLTANIKQTALLKTRVSYVSHDDCASHFENDEIIRENIRSDQLCANDPLGETRDACEGDSGGPLQLYINDDVVLAGIISFGNGCGKMGVYTRVSSFIDWIQKFV